MKIFENTSIKNYSNMKVGGIAKRLILVENKEEFIDLYKKYRDIFILGNGTNVMFGDGFIDRTIVCTKKINKISLDGDLLKVEAGATVKDLMEAMKNYDFTGLEKLAGIPGTIGGLIYMNGGAFGSEIFDNIHSVEVLDENLNVVEIKKENINFGYRYTEFQEKKCIIISVKFLFDKGFKEETVKEIRKEREKRHPLDKPSLGSTFKNPEGDFAARLISECGLKGYTVGGAQISEKHPNFILNIGNGTCEDIENIVEIVKEKVVEKFNIKLEEEIIVIK